MCVALIKPKGVFLPSEQILYNCFVTNPDGAGFCFAENEKVHIVKGLMDFDTFLNTLQSYDWTYDLNNKNVFIHFRIGTSGEMDETMTHPFPVSPNNKDLKQTEVSCNYAVIHNGVIPHYDYSLGKYSDTALFVRDFVYPMSKTKNWFKDENLPYKLYQEAHSKVAVMDKNGDFVYTDGFHDYKGILYSNYSYMGYRRYRKK